MIRRILTLSIALVLLGAAGADAQSPTPTPGIITETLCVAVRHQGDPMAVGDSTTVFEIEVLDPSECAPAVADPSLDMFSAYNERSLTSARKMLDILNAFDAVETYGELESWARRLVKWGKQEEAWLDKHQPADCYADLWDTSMSVAVHMRKAGNLYVKAARTQSASKERSYVDQGIREQDRATAALSDGNALMAETDYFQACSPQTIDENVV